MMPILNEDMETYKIDSVEVFSEGEWNKDKYTVNDLHQMVDAFNGLKGGFKPYLKLGHDNNQKLIKSSGLPSIGWVENLYVKGTKLFADLHNIPKEIYKLIKAKAYRKVSCEIYWDLDVNGIKYPKVLGALALLGAETPGVLNLADILSNYSLLKKNNTSWVFDAIDKQDSFKAYAISFEHKMEDDNMSEELDQAKLEIEAQKKSYATVEAAKTELEKTLETERQELSKYREEAAQAKLAEKAAKVSLFVSELEAKKLVTPSMKDLITELLSDKKEFTVKEKVMTKEEVLTQILTLSNEAAKVNFDESSRADFAKPMDKEKEADEKIQKYATDNKCSYAQAYKAVMKGVPMEDEEKPDKEKK